MKWLLVVLVAIVWPGATAWALSVTPERGGAAAEPLPDLAADITWLHRARVQPASVATLAPTTTTVVPSTTSTTRHTTPLPTPRAAAPRPRTIQVSGTCVDWLVAAGVADTTSALALIALESSCNPYAVNRSSGACGIPQALPCSKMNCAAGDAVCQLRWMDGYVADRYGSWASALSFRRRVGWY